MHIAKNARARSRRYQPLPPRASVRARARKEDKSEKKKRVRTPPLVKMHQSPVPPTPAMPPRIPSRSCRTVAYPPCCCGYSSRLAKIIVRRNFHARRAGILRAFAYDGNCSQRMMYGFVARRVRSSYYGRLNEQFLSTFILSGIARIYFHGRILRGTCSPYLQ